MKILQNKQLVKQTLILWSAFLILACQTGETPSASVDSMSYLLPESSLNSIESHLDHAGIIEALDEESMKRGGRTYNYNCINCHGNMEVEGSIPLATKFWQDTLKVGTDPYSMYQTVTRGYGSMPPQMHLTPRERYDVIHYIRQNFIKEENPEEFSSVSRTYLSGLPKGDSLGPATKPYHPWSDMDYGNFFINTYELVDAETGPERYHSPGPSPFPDEDYSANNFAYKGIAVRLDPGKWGIAEGNAWMIFDHDLMRVAGGWTGEGFIDWDAILLNDRHETYPRTVGKLHFETPVGPAWANPATGSFKDPRFRARDGRQFGPLPKAWANYRGLYHHGDKIIISYAVGQSEILEYLSQEESDGQIVFTRELNISKASSRLKMRIAPAKYQVAMSGSGASLSQEAGFWILQGEDIAKANIKLFISEPGFAQIRSVAENAAPPQDLSVFTQGGPAHYPQEIESVVTVGNDDNAFAIDQLTPPFDNPWKCRMKLSGIDFFEDANLAAACATDGDIWLISGLTSPTNTLTWRRIGSGLFQPLGLKIIDEKIFVTCRDQLVLLRDLNNDGETDYYESFNHDHQVSDHFHEFAMGLQADEQGNLYYAKSGRHAREALIPQHGTLIKVSSDGATSDIIATGFRAANGVCLNPDGSFFVTDQQGYWNPMNRINRIDVSGPAKFYGNMWGYDPPADSSRSGMEPPMIWVDMELDRSPSELLWVDSEKWGPLNGGLLSLSYGFGKIQWVLQQDVNGQKQGGVIDLPDIKFLTGVMRGRFNPEDGQLYACGMSAWGTSQLMLGGGLYRIRYTGKPISVPLSWEANEGASLMTFAQPLDAEAAMQISNYEINTWQLKRSKKYGSDRHDKKTLAITAATLSDDHRSVTLTIPEIAPTDGMTIQYKLKDADGAELDGTLQTTIHALQ